MTNEEKKYEEVERYISGEMQGEELAAFERLLQQDADLQKEVNLHRNLETWLADEGAMKLRDVLEQTGNKTQPAKVIPFYRRPLAVAASVLLLILAGYFTWQLNTGDSTTQLFAQNFEPYQVVFSPRSENPLQETRNAAINAYQQGRYAEAIEYFDKLQQEDSLGVAPAFYKGICYLARGDVDKSIQLLDSVKNIANPLFTEQSAWYLGLAFLKKNDTEKACAVFQQLQQANGYKQKEAATLAEKVCP